MLPFSIQYYPPDLKSFPLFRLAERYGSQPQCLEVVLNAQRRQTTCWDRPVLGSEPPRSHSTPTVVEDMLKRHSHYAFAHYATVE